jgi:hypothetical protein
VLRAFAAHFAESPDADDLHAEVGFGRLIERYDSVLDCAPNEATILYRDEIERGEMLSLPFPLSTDVIAGRQIHLHWTIAFVAPTDPKDSAEYTQAGLEATFRPHAQIRTFTNRETEQSRVINVETEPERVAELLAEGFTDSALPTTASHRRWRHETLFAAGRTVPPSSSRERPTSSASISSSTPRSRPSFSTSISTTSPRSAATVPSAGP